ncbi:MAG: hypothetical protein ACOVMK_08155 [Arenimonas sp.]
MAEPSIQDHLAMATAIVGFITLLGGTWARVAAWTEQRSIKAKFQDEIGLAERRIAFLGTWVKAQEAVCTPERFAEVKQESARELDELRSKLTEFMHQADERKDKVSAGKSVRRMFLLFLPHNLGGWTCHLLFYGLVLFVLLVALQPPSVNLETGQMETWGEWLQLQLFLNIMFAIPILLVRSLAIRYYRKRD